jgi:hypothetical protein
MPLCVALKWLSSHFNSAWLLDVQKVMLTGLPELPDPPPAAGADEPQPAAAAARAAMAPAATMALRCRIRFEAAARLS